MSDNYYDWIYEALNTLSQEAYKIAASKGFHDAPVPIAVQIANLHGEVSELWEAHRNHALNEPCDKAEKMRAMGMPVLTCLEEELADIIIRALDTAEDQVVDIAKAVRVKMAYNATRPRMNGGKAC